MLKLEIKNMIFSLEKCKFNLLSFHQEEECALTKTNFKFLL